MKREDLIIAFLAGTSVVLVILIVLTAQGRGPLMAQSADRAGGFVMFTGTYDQDIDAMYLLDERSGQLAVFLSKRGGRDLQQTDLRDLAKDFEIRPEVPTEERPRKPASTR